MNAKNNSGTNFKKKCCQFPADLEKRPQFSAQPMTAFSKRIFRWKDETVGHRIHANGTFTYMKTIKIRQLYTLAKLVVSTHLQNMSQIGNLPQIGIKIKNI